MHYIICCLLLLVSSCSYYVPEQDRIESSNRVKQVNLLHENNNALNAESIKIISWNNLAGCRQAIRNITAITLCNEEQADRALLQFSQDRDLILIQEAYLDSDTLQVLTDIGAEYSWDMAVSYIAHKIKEIPTGVLTVAKAQSLSAYPQRAYDTILATPKAILFSTYKLKKNNASVEEQLLVVNIHAILISQKYLYQQLQTMSEKISRHQGPVILAGDFNTMTADSYLKLIEIVTSIGLTEAKMESSVDHRVKSIFGQAYDFIFYKKLKLIDSYSINLKTMTIGKTSDHNPLFAEFKLSN